MRSTKTKRNSAFSPGVLSLTILLLILLLPATAGAADYWVWGRVYSASPLAEGEELPVNPLSDVFTSHPERIIGENLIPQVPRNLVKVEVIDASDGSELGNYIVRQDGGYLISFSATGASISVRFIVEELATSQVLLDSDPVILSPWPTPNMYFLLAAEASAEIDNDREYAPSPPLPAIYTAIFTRVGKIEVATEVGGTTQHLIDPATGLVDVPSTVADDLAIPEYEDAPLGGNLYIFGAFSRDLYDLSPSVHYRIHVQNVDDPTDHWYMSDELVKTKYTVNFTTGEVETERVTLGPWDVGGTPNCYELTPIAVSNNVFWSFPDLVALWRTGQFNGRYEITLEIIGLSSPADFAAIADHTDITLRLDNVAPVAKIDPLQSGDFDTPRVYTPGPVPASDDLLDALLGTFPADYGGTADPTCLILNLEPPGPTKYLAFNLTGYHANGFLRYWHFRYERNDKKNEILMGKKYDGTTNSMVDYSAGIRISSAQTDVGGFQDKYLYLDTDHLQPLAETTALGGCAYRFVIYVTTRTTDGYQYLRYRWDQDLHYVQR